MTDILSRLKNATPCLWLNSSKSNEQKEKHSGHRKFTLADMVDARARLHRFAPVLTEFFPELSSCNGIIDSELIKVDNFAELLREQYGVSPLNNLYVKGDHALPISGSVKARGGFYAVMCIAEAIALENGLLSKTDDDYRILGGNPAKKLFGKYRISVGSTGNLGLSIGVMGQAFGFRVSVHMSSDAKTWKKERLRSIGVEVIEHPGDYLCACSVARAEAAKDPYNVFIDDENSPELFSGYSVAAFHLQQQLAERNLAIGPDQPLFVYIPCGVGGAPGGITFGLKKLFANNVYCFFVEPVQAPCMMLGMATGKHSQVSVKDFGLSGSTCADGLAVARPSRFIGTVMADILDGCLTVRDEDMYRFVYLLAETEGLRLEPSATAGCAGPITLKNQAPADLKRKMSKAIQVIWTTGGGMVPEEDYREFLKCGKRQSQTGD